MNQTIKQALCKVVQDTGKDWDDKLPMVLAAIRSSDLLASGSRSAFVFYIKEPFTSRCVNQKGSDYYDSPEEGLSGPELSLEFSASLIQSSASPTSIRWIKSEGGPNPDLNTNLANIIEQCRSKSMPKASIEVAIKGGDKGKSSSYLLYEARGPGGSALLIEVLTDNAKRAYQDVRLILSRNGAQMSDGARHSFDKKGVITVSGQDSQQRPVALEQALELAIEAGAQDVWEEDDDEERAVLKFVCEVPSLHQVREKLDSLGLQSLSAALEFIPNARVRLSDEEMERASQLLATLGDCQEVIRVYDNIE
ncbi:translational activator of cytochrome c oxidase 1 [Terrapene carolina triunguis]|uniref:translational activator of cytochrome c oxidase 1 n=1 Tax=Terrapene triunguis TaxID=2587831 RepID=UPI001156C06F|nr:translational activator of cytochrome c oxidase 1 [Terrapene carolina triunguis]